MLLIILTLGWFAKNWKYVNSENKQTLDIDELSKKKTKLLEVQKKIKELELKKKEIEQREVRFFIFVRILIGVFLIFLNVIYFITSNKDFKLDAQLNFNGAVLLSYSFLAFITYGTPSKFVQALKSKAAYYLNKKHVDVFIELEQLIKEQDILKLEIENNQNFISNTNQV